MLGRLIVATGRKPHDSLTWYELTKANLAIFPFNRFCELQYQNLTVLHKVCVDKTAAQPAS